MRTWTYPFRLDHAGPDHVFAVFDDVPEVITGWTTAEEARIAAPDALATAIEMYIEDGELPPRPRTARAGEEVCVLDPEVAARAALVFAMAEQNLTNVALAEKLGRDEKAVRRMLSGKGASLESVLKALRVLGLTPALAA